MRHDDLGAVLLTSCDGQDFARVVLFYGKSYEQAERDAAKAIADGHKAGGDDWTWEEHVEPRIVAAGFFMPAMTVRDVQWDNPEDQE
jgi:hypothetical protein